MNKLELSNVSILKDIVEHNGVIGIKTSFEDEGASFNEVLRLKELCNQAGTKLLLKISGAEAKRDLADSIVIGVKGIVAPMIESPFALEKYIEFIGKYSFHKKSILFFFDTSSQSFFILDILNLLKAGAVIPASLCSPPNKIGL